MTQVKHSSLGQGIPKSSLQARVHSMLLSKVMGSFFSVCD